MKGRPTKDKQSKLYQMLLTRPLTEIPHSGSKAYQAFWDGYYGNVMRKYLPSSYTGIAFKAGNDRAIAHAKGAL